MMEEDQGIIGFYLGNVNPKVWRQEMKKDNRKKTGNVLIPQEGRK